MAKDKGKEFIGPMGICTCGHTGAGENSEHDADNESGIFKGFGRCLKKGCECKGFATARNTRKYQNFLAAQRLH